MRSKHVLWLLGLGMFLCSACEPLGGQWYIDIKNDSSEEILVATGCKKENRLIYLTTEFPAQEDLSLQRVLPGQERSYIQPYHLMVLDDNALLAIFIISPEVYENYSWKEIGEKEMFLKKYVFRYGDMRTKYPITYPKDYD